MGREQKVNCKENCPALYIRERVAAGWRATCAYGNKGLEVVGVLPSKVGNKAEFDITDVAMLECLYPDSYK